LRILADSPIWIDYLRGVDAPAFDRVIDTHQVILGDLILAEIMRGVVGESAARKVAMALDAFETVDLCGKEVAHAAAKNCRLLRSRGVTVPGTIDLIIGSWCILNDTPLLHSDRDFGSLETHLGLRRWTGHE
jgi:predicted nucleic acid-binding protein